MSGFQDGGLRQNLCVLPLPSVEPRDPPPRPTSVRSGSHLEPEALEEELPDERPERQPVQLRLQAGEQSRRRTRRRQPLPLPHRVRLHVPEVLGDRDVKGTRRLPLPPAQRSRLVDDAPRHQHRDEVQDVRGGLPVRHDEPLEVPGVQDALRPRNPRPPSPRPSRPPQRDPDLQTGVVWDRGCGGWSHPSSAPSPSRVVSVRTGHAPDPGLDPHNLYLGGLVDGPGPPP